MGAGLKKRLKIALPTTAVVSAAIFYSPILAYSIGMIIILRSLWEFYNLYKGETLSFSRWALLFSALYLYLAANQYTLALTPLAITGILGVFILQTFDKKNEKGMAKIALTVMGFMYITYLGSYFFHIYHLKPAAKYWGPGLLFLTVFTCKFSDACAYFAGSRLGRHKLIPRISPNKSWEGLIGGFVGAIV
ncbi:MAG: phosphatidate cytidylyltransferase, partial [Planctomycetes bacterium]|nr:phosphatidate cytidylyltransferase [Planctomycetota bacterium]